MECAACNQVIVKPKKKHQNASYTLCKVVNSPQVTSVVFPGIKYVGPETVICLKCHVKLKSATVGVARSQKRRLPEEPAEAPPAKKAKLPTTNERLGSYLAQHCYEDFVSYAQHNSPALWRHMVNRVMVVLRKEVGTFLELIKGGGVR